MHLVPAFIQNCAWTLRVLGFRLPRIGRKRFPSSPAVPASDRLSTSCCQVVRSHSNSDVLPHGLVPGVTGAAAGLNVDEAQSVVAFTSSGPFRNP